MDVQAAKQRAERWAEWLRGAADEHGTAEPRPVTLGPESAREIAVLLDALAETEAA